MRRRPSLVARGVASGRRRPVDSTSPMSFLASSMAGQLVLSLLQAQDASVEVAHDVVDQPVDEGDEEGGLAAEVVADEGLVLPGLAAVPQGQGRVALGLDQPASGLQQLTRRRGGGRPSRWERRPRRARPQAGAAPSCCPSVSCCEPAAILNLLQCAEIRPVTCAELHKKQLPVELQRRSYCGLLLLEKQDPCSTVGCAAGGE